MNPLEQFSKFRRDVDRLTDFPVNGKGDKLLAKTIASCREEGMSRYDTVLRVIEVLTCEINKHDS